MDQKKYGKAGSNFGSSPGASIRLSPPLCTNKLTLYSRLLRCMGGIKIVRLQHPETLAPHYTNKLTLYSRLLRCVMGCRVSWIIICHFFLIHVWFFLQHGGCASLPAPSTRRRHWRGGTCSEGQLFWAFWKGKFWIFLEFAFRTPVSANDALDIKLYMDM